MANTKLSAFLSLLMVFMSGIAVGGVGYHVYNNIYSRRPSPEQFRNKAINDMVKEVHLDSQQVVLLKQIYEETSVAFGQARAEENAKLHAEGQTIHDKQVERIKQILRPDQIPLYDALRQRREAERRKMREQNHKGEIKKDQ
jgi:hypothetical protein